MSSEDLFEAIGENNLNEVNRLIAEGVDVNVHMRPSIITTARPTPLIHAVLYGKGNDDIVRALIAAGADLNDTNIAGVTAIHFAALRRGNASIVVDLIEAGANVNVVSIDGWTPLIFAVMSGGVNIVRILLRAGARADIGKTDVGGGGPLHLAAKNGDKEIVRLIIASGANLDSPDINGHCAIDYARAYEHRGIEEMLLAAGARNSNKHTTNPLANIRRMGIDTPNKRENNLGAIYKKVTNPLHRKNSVVVSNPAYRYNPPNRTHGGSRKLRKTKRRGTRRAASA